MSEFRFLDWQVYNESQGLFSELLKVVKKLSQEYRFEMGSQMIRSSLSISLNIAEGSGKWSDKELNRYFNIALESLYETLAAADILKRNRFIDGAEFRCLYGKIQSIAKQLHGFKKTLK